MQHNFVWISKKLCRMRHSFIKYFQNLLCMGIYKGVKLRCVRHNFVSDCDAISVTQLHFTLLCVWDFQKRSLYTVSVICPQLMLHVYLNNYSYRRWHPSSCWPEWTYWNQKVREFLSEISKLYRLQIQDSLLLNKANLDYWWLPVGIYIKAQKLK